MQLISYLTSSLSLGVGWFMGIIYNVTMFFEGFVFFLVSYSYKLFSLMCSLNLNSLYAIVAPLVDRLKAVVMVFIVFKLGMSLIGYMLEPESAPKGGKSLVINIAISAMFLVSYEFIFGLFNELSLLVMGVPEGYSFTVLNQFVDIDDGEDPGLIMRYVFGDVQDMDVGDYISYETLSMFVRDSQGNSGQLMKALTSTKNSTTVRDGSLNFLNLNDVVPYIEKTIEYTPVLPFLIGIYLIYQIVVNSIQIGVRMFKLLILQIIAPIPIISIIDEKGIKSSNFQSFVKTYTSTLLNAFVRMLSFLIVTAFVSKFFLNIEEFLGTTVESSGFTKILILMLVIVAGYKFAGDIPKFINEALGTKLDFGEPKFGSFMSGMLGGTIGAATGLATGIAAGAGVSGIIGNMAAGAAAGGSGMQKGKTISDKIKSIGTANTANAERATNIARQGGGFAYLGHNIEKGLGVAKMQSAQATREKDKGAALENMMKARSEAISKQKNDIGIKYGDSADSYASQMMEYDQDVINAKTAYESATDSAAKSAAWSNYIAARDNATEKYKSDYNAAMFSDKANTAEVKNATKIYDSKLSSKEKQRFGTEALAATKGDYVSDAKKQFSANEKKANQKGSIQRENRQSIYGGK